MAYALLLFVPLSLVLRYLFYAPAGWVFLTSAAVITGSIIGTTLLFLGITDLVGGIPTPHRGLTCAESWPSYRPGTLARPSRRRGPNRGKRELWKATVDLDATDQSVPCRP